MEDTEQRGPGIENGSEWSNGTVHFDRTKPIHSDLDQNFLNFWLNGSRPLCLDLPEAIIGLLDLPIVLFEKGKSCVSKMADEDQ